MSEEFWNALAATEERDLDDEKINRDLRWREIDRMPHGIPPVSHDELLDLCEAYDREVLPHGPGSFRRAGLLAAATSRATSAS